jgi:hypothetical protein
MSQSLESAKHLERRVQVLEAQNKELQGWRSRAESLSIALEEEKRRAKYQTEDKKDQAEDRDGERVYRDEFNREVFSMNSKQIVAYWTGQKGYLSSMSTKLHVAETDLKELLEEKETWDQREKKAAKVERMLYDQISQLNDQLVQARKDREYVISVKGVVKRTLTHSSITQSFRSDETPAESAATLQAKFTALCQVHDQASAELAGKKSELEQLHQRLTDLANTTQSTIAHMAKEQRELERELRWAKQNAASAESREKMAKQELDTYLYHNEPSVSALSWFYVFLAIQEDSS